MNERFPLLFTACVGARMFAYIGSELSKDGTITGCCTQQPWEQRHQDRSLRFCGVWDCSWLNHSRWLFQSPWLRCVLLDETNWIETESECVTTTDVHLSSWLSLAGFYNGYRLCRVPQFWPQRASGACPDGRLLFLISILSGAPKWLWLGCRSTNRKRQYYLPPAPTDATLSWQCSKGGMIATSLKSYLFIFISEHSSKDAVDCLPQKLHPKDFHKPYTASYRSRWSNLFELVFLELVYNWLPIRLCGDLHSNKRHAYLPSFNCFSQGKVPVPNWRKVDESAFP